MTGEKMYEVEVNRTNISPKQFYTYATKKFKAKTGEDFYWIDGYNDWSDPVQESDTITADEICRVKPYDWHLFCRGAYNFIMEWNDGHGYMYALEWER